MKCRVSVIRKRGRRVIKITIKIEKIIFIIHFTQTDKNKKNKQTKRKKNLAYARIDLRLR